MATATKTATRRRPYTARMPPEARREQLLDAALRVIARRGYSGVSIDAIAREADVTRPVVYGVFDGLEPLLYALLDRQEKRALESLMGAVPADLDTQGLDSGLVEMVRRLTDMVRSDPLAWRPILAPPEGTPRAVRERIARDREVVRARFERLLEGALADQGDDLDLEVVSHALIGVAEYFGRMLIEEPDRYSTERLISTVESVVALALP
jgi:AcrR family transcriptional regulator